MTVLSKLEAESIYDRMLEEVRHALLQIHSWVAREDATALLPLIDLLTSLHCGSAVPVASGVIAPRAGSGLTAADARSKEVLVILRSQVQLAMVLPFPIPGRIVPELHAASALTRLLSLLGEDRWVVGFAGRL